MPCRCCAAVLAESLKCRLVLRLDSLDLLANDGLIEAMATASASSTQLGASRKV